MSTLKMWRIAGIFAGAMMLAPTMASANLQQQMNSMFGSLVNTTSPQAYKGQRMGAFFGGSAYVRNKIVNTNIIGFVPPHISAGCGGIDMFAGSFSFINASQFQNLLRSIASNATGYFFQIALQTMCPTCMEEMSKLQKAVQGLNSLAGNSCMLGKAMVDSAAMAVIPGDVAQDSVLGRVRDAAAKDAAANTPAFQDAFDSLWPLDNTNTENKISATDPNFLKNNGYIGNVAWMLMKDSAVGSWMSFGDQDMEETIMSLTGTFVAYDANTTVASPGGTDKSLSSKVYDPILSPEDLVYGNKNRVEIYRCGADPDCMMPTKTAVTNFKDFTTRITEILVGNGTSPGIVMKFANPTGQAYTPTETAFIENTPAPIVAMIRSLAQQGEFTAKMFAESLAPWIAREMAYRFASEMIRAMRVAANQAKPEMEDNVKAYNTILGDVASKLFEMKKSEQDTDTRFLRALQTFQNVRLQTLGEERMATRMRPDANAASH